MTDDELADALSSDFTCSIPSAEEKKTSLTEVLIPFFFFGHESFYCNEVFLLLF